MRSWLSGGVYGTVLASALLAALQSEGTPYTPYYDAAWVMVTAGTAALAHGYAHHMASHRPGSGLHRWRQLGWALADEWPVVVACWPTVALLVTAGAMGWPEKNVTCAGLMLNAALLFGWGTFAALRVGYRRGAAVLIGVADAAIGVVIAVANAVIK
ncbi:hypothetical protein [Streptomyces flavofungini]|uniref:Integral membrane protein n=1 Tax=Streptomyces flavofungini TaxID=68200 RepID=A0ABS0XDM3_9ACTN|nr:hypothetical protein [Streptomyces flavofungini]MBJ3811316.1 hypothetical protein [Streptomyces flavofungini]GHC66187.1 hypothetical protein GCM10010349_38600 [Streptomyces flavofungini]